MFKINTNSKKHGIKREKNKTWFTKDCKSRRNVFRKCSRKLSRSPFNRTNLHNFIKARSAYKKVCRKAEKDSRKNLTRLLMNIGKSDTKGFWKIINKMNNWGKEINDPSNIISPEMWNKHFRQLLNKDERLNTEPGRYKPFCTFDPILDSRFTLKEMREALTELKAGKAPVQTGCW